MKRHKYVVTTSFSVEVEFDVKTPVILELEDDADPDDPDTFDATAEMAIKKTGLGPSDKEIMAKMQSAAAKLLKYPTDYAQRIGTEAEYVGLAEDEPWQESNPGV